MVTSTFKAVGSETFDLTDVTPMRDVSGVPTAFSTTSPATMCNGLISIVKISSEGNYGEAYYYYCTKTKNGWYLGKTSTVAVEKGAVPFSKGEAMLVPVKVSYPPPDFVVSTFTAGAVMSGFMYMLFLV